MFTRILRITVWSALGVLFALPMFGAAIANADSPFTPVLRQQTATSGYGATLPSFTQQEE